jgi:mannose-6-phosphate isomerase-like protein (cupin superfamily)
MTTTVETTTSAASANAPVLERIDPYREWQRREGVHVNGGVYVRDMKTVEVDDWPRKGVKGAVCYLDGDNDYDEHVVEIPPGKSTTPEHHLYDEAIYILKGRGATTVWFDENTKQTFEWGEGSFFALPTNAWYQFFNGSGTEPARYFSVTNLPRLLREFHNPDFIFNDTYSFTDRYSGEHNYFSSEGKLWKGRNWEANFIPDVRTMRLWEYKGRGGGGTNGRFMLAGGTIGGHISRFQQGTYKKGHSSDAGAHLLLLSGEGYSTTILDKVQGVRGDGPEIRFDWAPGSLFLSGCGPGFWYHQHYNLSNGPATYLVIGVTKSRRYAANRWEAEKATDLDEGAVDVKLGGKQTEYPDEDPRVHQVFEEELGKLARPCRMKALVPWCTGEVGPTEKGEWGDEH